MGKNIQLITTIIAHYLEKATKNPVVLFSKERRRGNRPIMNGCMGLLPTGPSLFQEFCELGSTRYLPISKKPPMRKMLHYIGDLPIRDLEKVIVMRRAFQIIIEYQTAKSPDLLIAVADPGILRSVCRFSAKWNLNHIMSGPVNSMRYKFLAYYVWTGQQKRRENTRYKFEEGLK